MTQIRIETEHLMTHDQIEQIKKGIRISKNWPARKRTRYLASVLSILSIMESNELNMTLDMLKHANGNQSEVIAELLNLTIEEHNAHVIDYNAKVALFMAGMEISAVTQASLVKEYLSLNLKAEYFKEMVALANRTFNQKFAQFEASYHEWELLNRAFQLNGKTALVENQNYINLGKIAPEFVAFRDEQTDQKLIIWVKNPPTMSAAAYLQLLSEKMYHQPEWLKNLDAFDVEFLVGDQKRVSKNWKMTFQVMDTAQGWIILKSSGVINSTIWSYGHSQAPGERPTFKPVQFSELVLPVAPFDEETLSNYDTYLRYMTMWNDVYHLLGYGATSNEAFHQPEKFNPELSDVFKNSGGQAHYLALAKAYPEQKEALLAGFIPHFFFLNACGGIDRDTHHIWKDKLEKTCLWLEENWNLLSMEDQAVLCEKWGVNPTCDKEWILNAYLERECDQMMGTTGMKIDELMHRQNEILNGNFLI